MTLTEQAIATIAAGCEGVTEGPWRAEEGRDAARGILAPEDKHGISMIIADVYSWPEVVADNAAHIARLDPATVLALCALAQEALQSRREGQQIGTLRSLLKTVLIETFSDHVAFETWRVEAYAALGLPNPNLPAEEPESTA